MFNILFKFATRSRPTKFLYCLENIVSKLSDKDNYEILISYDEDDSSMTEMLERCGPFEFDGHFFFCGGLSKNKIHAINRDIEKATGWDILINTSDDMVFIQDGFDDIIRKDMKEHFPDGDCLLHYPDQNQGENCMTMSIMDRKYFDRFGYIYHPDYESLESDIEAQEVGKILGRYKFINKRLFNHNHPSFGQVPYDNQYDKTEGRYDTAIRTRDRNTFLNRKANNFYL